MRRLAICLAIITLPGLAFFAFTQEPAPPPREVDPVVANPARTRLYTVQVFRDGVYVDEAGADRRHQLDGLIYTLSLRHCTAPRDYQRTPEGWLDPTKPIQRPRIEIAIWGEPEQLWLYADIERLGKREFFALPLTVRVNAGSYGID